jgi:hypothetical protein
VSERQREKERFTWYVPSILSSLLSQQKKMNSLQEAFNQAKPYQLSNGTKILTVRVKNEDVEDAIKLAKERGVTWHDVTLEPPVDGLRELSFLTYPK